MKAVYPIVNQVLKAKYVEDRDERVKKASANFFKFLYYSLCSLFGYYVVKDMDMVPPIMGGSGHISNAFHNYPYI